MGAEQVGSAVLEWLLDALKRDPLLVAPTLVLAGGVAVLAFVEAITFNIQIATTILHHFRKRVSELVQALRDFGNAIRLHPKQDVSKPFETESVRPRVVQRDLLSKQRPLFDKKDGQRSA
ncbi:MAG TPA: hypothetical protein VGR95_04905 [Thermoanaerobaculia bacterium]|jgi:hypothetical protein|nr:hypothetical protein [Thermoanaerobaculia bacterium]